MQSVPKPILPISEHDQKRFWASVKVVPGEGCWEWQKAVQPRGLQYGIFGIRPPGGKAVKQLQYKAHRVAWYLANGDIPEGKLVLHKCDNPKCVRLDHLFLGSPKDNMQDKCKKGRQVWAWGETQWASKLTEEQVIEIIKRNRIGESQSALAREYGVWQAQIGRICRGERWRHVDRNRI